LDEEAGLPRDRKSEPELGNLTARSGSRRSEIPTSARPVLEVGSKSRHLSRFDFFFFHVLRIEFI
jgi:hypothetical protein